MTKAVVLSLCLVGAMIAPVWAQEIPLARPAGQNTPPAVPDGARIAERDLYRRALPRVVATISAQAGVQVLVTLPLLEQRIRVPETVATRGNLEAVLTDLAHRLPNARWAKIYLPTLPGAKRYRADAVAILIQAGADVYRLPDKPQDGKAPPKTVLIQGRWLTEEDAKPLIKTLQLEPVYVLMSRSATTLTLTEQTPPRQGITDDGPSLLRDPVIPGQYYNSRRMARPPPPRTVTRRPRRKPRRTDSLRRNFLDRKAERRADGIFRFVKKHPARTTVINPQTDPQAESSRA